MLDGTNIVRMPSRMLNTAGWKSKGHCHWKMRKDNLIQINIKHKEMTAMEKHFHVPLSVYKRELFICSKAFKILVIYNKNE